MNIAVTINLIEHPKISFNAQSGGLCLKWSPSPRAMRLGTSFETAVRPNFLQLDRIKFRDSGVINFLSAVPRVELMKTL